MVINALKRAAKYFEDLLFINCSCISCGIEIDSDTRSGLCKRCEKKLERTTGPVMLTRKSAIHSTKKIKIKNPSLCMTYTLLYYNEISASIVKQFKYSGKKYYAKYMARMITDNMDIFNDIDVLTFVPVSERGLAQRGYNQSEELAKEISKITKIPVERSVGKKEGFLNQAGLSQVERLNNLKDAFYIFEEQRSKLNGKRLLLVDDVFTTGTTLTRVTNELKKFKPSSIKCLTFAKTKYDMK